MDKDSKFAEPVPGIAEPIGAKETGTPGVFKQDTYKVAYRNGFEKKKQGLSIKRKEAIEIAAKKQKSVLSSKKKQDEELDAKNKLIEELASKVAELMKDKFEAKKAAEELAANAKK